MINRDFFYVHINLSQYREKKKNLFFVIYVENRRNEWSTGLVRYFFNTDNKSPLFNIKTMVMHQQQQMNYLSSLLQMLQRMLLNLILGLLMENLHLLQLLLHIYQKEKLVKLLLLLSH